MLIFFFLYTQYITIYCQFSYTNVFLVGNILVWFIY